MGLLDADITILRINPDRLVRFSPLNAVAVLLKVVPLRPEEVRPALESGILRVNVGRAAHPNL